MASLVEGGDVADEELQRRGAGVVFPCRQEMIEALGIGEFGVVLVEEVGGADGAGLTLGDGPVEDEGADALALGGDPERLGLEEGGVGREVDELVGALVDEAVAGDAVLVGGDAGHLDAVAGEGDGGKLGLELAGEGAFLPEAIEEGERDATEVVAAEAVDAEPEDDVARSGRGNGIGVEEKLGGEKAEQDAEERHGGRMTEAAAAGNRRAISPFSGRVCRLD